MDPKITRLDIINSIKEAQMEMESAQNKLNNATTESEIDIAIYYMIAAEKKVDMLYKTAKESLG